MSEAVILAPIGSSAVELPFFSARVPAGFPSPAQDHLEKTISLDTLLDIDAPHTYLVRAHGDSMIGAGIFDGDVLVVSRALTARHGDIVIAAINGDSFVKRFTVQNGQLVLCSENPRYPPRYILEGDELLIWGVVTDSIRRHGNHG
ncbi:translesion error-prone DNA polymerase V autoproteolytic subunit [Pseudomonas sp. gcc21]|uniref:LexA family protein n=1 Tax=Pseudomonas sp. gcc21 TaxID=2726989 RepID=UPI001451F5AA|nr:translesion error-prone DNA polymerase V autoproteolytic subunit [Pseudomonas sp. gcc21]QJD60693.1 translesion error-prone DNA polymerase V autoproteolytic subunit [Pseudomonas sp. gcc21]